MSALESLRAANDATPEPCVAPYQAGYEVDFHVLETTHSDNIVSPSTTVTAKINHIISTNKAVVMHVTVKTDPEPTSAILQLYDRRFGTSLRRDNEGNHVPCLISDEVAFHSFVLRGSMGRFLKEVQDLEDAEGKPTQAARWNEGPDGQAKFDAALWRMARQHFQTEVEAYKRLKDIQGLLIPKMYATVRVATTDLSSDYFNVNGILLQFIPGCSFNDLPQSPSAPASLDKWSALVQTAVDAAFEINKRGIIINDSGPDNVIVDTDTEKPFIVDFAQCAFKDRLFQLWEETERNESWTPEGEWIEAVNKANNPASIGRVMVNKVQESHGFPFGVTYPDCEKVLELKGQ
ncbi:hypothetical protein IL306_015053 [Fusarium sp. DS 682]|nr:hypothetical protein IL306_015053 [Fusarium sp. DS 682]